MQYMIVHVKKLSVDSLDSLDEVMWSSGVQWKNWLFEWKKVPFGLSFDITFFLWSNNSVIISS